MQAVARFSSPTSKRVLGGISSTRFRSKSWARGKSSTASVQNDSPLNPQKKSLKNIPKDQRRAVIQTFVENYRTLNGGKFPPCKLVKQELGGSHYTIRAVVQEMQYAHKMSPQSAPGNQTQTLDSNLKKPSSGEASSEPKEGTPLYSKIEETVKPFVEESIKKVGYKEGHSGSTDLKVSGFKKQVVASKVGGSTSYSRSVKQAKASSEEVSSEPLHGDHRSEHEQHEKSPPSVEKIWGNLKSFALNFWKKW